MTDHTQQRDAFRASASRLVAARYPHVLGALLGGSAARGRATASSDLDVAVLLPDREHSGREVVRHEGRVAELFLNTVADLPEFFAWDRARRRGTVLFLYDRGLPLAAGLAWGLGNEIQLGADVQDAWEFVGELAQWLRERDPNHPVATVTAPGSNANAAALCAHASGTLSKPRPARSDQPNRPRTATPSWSTAVEANRPTQPVWAINSAATGGPATHATETAGSSEAASWCSTRTG